MEVRRNKSCPKNRIQKIKTETDKKNITTNKATQFTDTYIHKFVQGPSSSSSITIHTRILAVAQRRELILLNVISQSSIAIDAHTTTTHRRYSSRSSPTRNAPTAHFYHRHYYCIIIQQKTTVILCSQILQPRRNGNVLQYKHLSSEPSIWMALCCFLCVLVSFRIRWIAYAANNIYSCALHEFFNLNRINMYAYSKYFNSSRVDFKSGHNNTTCAFGWTRFGNAFFSRLIPN